VLDLPHPHPRTVELDEKSDDRSLQASPHHSDLREWRVRDPHLRAREQVAVAVAHGLRPHPRRIGTVIRLGKPEAADGLTSGHPGQPVLLVVLTTEAPDAPHRERALHRDEASQRGVAALELATSHSVGERGHPGTAVAAKVHPKHAQLRQLRDHLAREGRLLEMLTDDGSHLVSEKPAKRVADRTYVVRQLGVESKKVAAGPRHCVPPPISAALV
jgi:hypothetical protein